MPLILRALTATGQLSLALIDQAASSLFGILRTAIQHNPAPTEGVEDVSAETPITTETDGGVSPTDDASHPPEEQRSGSSSASDSSDSDYDENSDSSEASLDEVAFETHWQEHEEQPGAADLEQAVGEPIGSASSTRSTRPVPTQGTSRNTRRASDHPYRYSAPPLASGTANLAEHLQNSPVRRHRDFIRAGARTPPPAPAPIVAPTPPRRTLPQINAVASGSRPAKRPRESDADDSSTSEAETEFDEPPRTRRRRSISHPGCTRAECDLARNLHRFDNGFSARRAMMEEEETWSTAAQASDVDPDPDDAVFDDASDVGEDPSYTVFENTRSRTRGRRRSREDREDEDSDATERSQKRSRRT